MSFVRGLDNYISSFICSICTIIFLKIHLCQHGGWPSPSQHNKIHEQRPHLSVCKCCVVGRLLITNACSPPGFCVSLLYCFTPTPETSWHYYSALLCSPACLLPTLGCFSGLHNFTRSLTCTSCMCAPGARTVSFPPQHCLLIQHLHLNAMERNLLLVIYYFFLHWSIFN